MKTALTPLENQLRAASAIGYQSIHLVREGDYAVVSVEIGELWIPVIREHVDGAFSHIIEPLGIEEAIGHYFAERETLFTFRNHRDWVNHARTRFELAGHSSKDTICIDVAGRIAGGGKAFADAETDGTYPIRVYSTRASDAQGRPPE